MRVEGLIVGDFECVNKTLLNHRLGSARLGLARGRGVYPDPVLMGVLSSLCVPAGAPVCPMERATSATARGMWTQTHPSRGVSKGKGQGLQQ